MNKIKEMYNINYIKDKNYRAKLCFLDNVNYICFLFLTTQRWDYNKTRQYYFLAFNNFWSRNIKYF